MQTLALDAARVRSPPDLYPIAALPRSPLASTTKA